MGKVLAAIASILVLLIAAVLVGPSFIDRNDYKADIAGQVKNLTGRDLVINGDIRIAVLPAPAVSATDVSLSNLPGAGTTEMVRLKSVEVRIALAPLLGGQVKVETVKLVEPVINLEVLADGRKNWVFGPAAEDKDGDSGQSAGGGGPAASTAEPSVVLDDFTIVGGTLVYRDAVGGVSERVDAINARVEAASLQGPFRTTGALTARNIPLEFDLSTGEVMQGRSFPFNAAIKVEPGGTALQSNGTVIGLDDQPRFKGNVKFDSGNLAALLALDGVDGLPGIMAQSFGLSGALTASAKGAEMKDFKLAMNGTQASGDIAVDLGDTIDTAVRLSIKSIDLDKWLEKTAVPTPPAAPATGKAESNPAGGSTAKAAGKGAADKTGAMALPANLSGSLILSADAVAYRGGLIRDLLVNAELGDGEVTISQVSAQFPGGSDMAVFGTVSLKDGTPKFGGEIETTINDLRGVMKWLGTDIAGVPADRLRKMRIASKVTATPKQIQVSGLDLQFDSSRLTGAVTVALRKRPSFGASLVLDRINIDAYMPKAAAKPRASKPATSGKSADNAGASTKAGNKAEKTAANPFAVLGALTQFDANVKSRIKTLVYQGEQVKSVAVDATLYNGGLTLRNLSVGKVAGASAAIKGAIENLGGVPRAKGLKVDFKSKNVAPLFRLAEVKPPIDMRKVGAVSVSGTLDGPLLAPKVDYTVKGGGATVTAKGTINVLPVGDMADLNLRLRHGDFARLLRLAGSDYRPSGKIGAVDFSARVKGGTDLLNLSGLQAKIGTLTVNGALSANLKWPKPVITADLKTGPIAVDPFLPAAKKAGADWPRWAGLVRRTAAWSLPHGTPHAANDNRRRPTLIATRGRWPADPIDLSALKTVDADVTLLAPVITYDKYLVEKADIKAGLRDGVLSLEKFTGKVFDGQLNATGLVSAGATNRVSLVAKLANGSIAEATQSVAGKAIATGKLTTNVNLTTAGRSVADFVASLGGNGALNMTGIDPSSGGEGSALAGIIDLLTSLNQLGGSRKGTSADVSGTFQISRGIARSQDIRLVSGVGNGTAAATVDLPNWHLDVNGEVELAQNVLTSILKAKIRESRNAVPFSLSGPLDAPNVKVDTGALLGSSVPVPGADILLDKAPKGVGGVLKNILGGGKSQQTTTGGDTPPPAQGDTPPPPRSTTKQPKADPLDQLLKGLLK